MAGELELKIRFSLQWKAVKSIFISFRLGQSHILGICESISKLQKSSVMIIISKADRLSRKRESPSRICMIFCQEYDDDTK